MKRLLGFLLLLAAQLHAQVTASQMGYTYTIPYDSTNVTIGVKDSTGALIRTIQPAGQPKNAGTYNGIWDGNTDTGIAATGGPFTIAVLYGNPGYTFNGYISNTQNNWTGYDRWNYFWDSPPQQRFTFVNGVGWASSGYSEGINSLAYFKDGDPNTPRTPNITYASNGWIQLCDIANDGTYLYAANCTSSSVSGMGYNTVGAWGYVTKFDGRTGQPAFFTDPSVNTCTPANYPQAGCNGMIIQGPNINANAVAPFVTYAGLTMSAIDVIKNTASNPIVKPATTIAVQSGAGNILAVGHANKANSSSYTAPAIVTNNDIKFFDKNTGLPLGADALVANPTSMGFTSAGLWVVGDGVLTLVANPSGANTPSNPITGLSFPMAVDTNPANDHIYVLDGGTSQQLKEFDASYNLVRTYGVAGGYTDCNPTVASNRLMIDNRALTGNNGLNPYYGNIAPLMPWVRVETNGDVWVTDVLGWASNFSRTQHLTPSGATFNYVNQIVFANLSYASTVSHNAQSRTFVKWLEYQINWDTPNPGGDPSLPGGTGAWKLVRDWQVGTAGACGSSDPFTMMAASAYSGFAWTEQLSNGHFYATARSSQAINYIVELPQSGTSPLRFIGSMPVGPPYTNGTANMAVDGSMHWHTATGTGAGATENLWVMQMTGFDGSNNPQWGPKTLVQAVTYNQTQQPTINDSGGGTNSASDNVPTISGVYPGVQWGTYYGRALPNGPTNYVYPHLSGIMPGRSTYFYQGLMEGCSTNQNTNGTYPCGAGTGNIGTAVLVEGHQFLVTYCSQGAPNSSYNLQYWHYWEDGMFVGQFAGWSANSWTPIGPNYVSPAARVNTNNPALGWKGVQPQLQGFAQNCGTGHTLTSTASGNIFLVMASESYSNPVHSWKISNLSSIHEIAGTGNLGQSVIVNTPVF